MKLNVAFLWHMHQPLYLDPNRDTFVMPWVRLHSIKAYTDMICCLDQVPEARATFNLVPSLLYQVEAYNQGKGDTFLDLSLKPATELTPTEQDFMLQHFFSCNWPTMVEPYPRYRELLSKRGRGTSREGFSSVRGNFTTQDLLDLQVWFNLTWVGFTGRKNPLVASLLKKGRGFTEKEKQGLLDVHKKLMKDLIPEYVKRWKSGQIEISTTPFYHPILPLIYDSDLARRCMPGAKLPRRFNFPQDARTQLARSVEYCRRILGDAPGGLWPSEGSVAPELVPLMEESGFSWAATDEGVLFHSLDTHGPYDLFQPYRVEADGKSVNMIFRHHELSDLLGFVYHKNVPQAGIQDFLRRLRSLRTDLQEMNRPPLVAVILDGENPWEYYQDGGENLLYGIYKGIVDDPDLNLVTVSDYLKEAPPTRTLSNLYTGSWINHDFGIWIGDKEENRAWEELGHARRIIEQLKTGGDEDTKNHCDQAMEYIYAAEGSDWFWWYGEQFVTDYAFEFDHLFRAYLQKAYRILGLSVPDGILAPIRETVSLRPKDEPAKFIHPVIDGHITTYWEWVGAGTVLLEELGGAMHLGKGGISGIVFGFDLENLYIRLDPREKKGLASWNPDVHLRLNIKAKNEIAIDLIPNKYQNNITWESAIFIDDVRTSREETGIECAAKDLFEILIPFSTLNALPGDELNMELESRRDGLVLDRWPRNGIIIIKVPDKDFERRHWLV